MRTDGRANHVSPGSKAHRASLSALRSRLLQPRRSLSSQRQLQRAAAVLVPVPAAARPLMPSRSHALVSTMPSGTLSKTRTTPSAMRTSMQMSTNLFLATRMTKRTSSMSGSCSSSRRDWGRRCSLRHRPPPRCRRQLHPSRTTQRRALRSDRRHSRATVRRATRTCGGRRTARWS